MPEALNIGFRRSKGEYLTWTSDDNMYLSRALEEMSCYLDQHEEFPMVCTSMLFMDEDMKYLREKMPYKQDGMYMSDLVGASFMYRRRVLAEVGEYSKQFFCVEDYEYWIRLLQRYGSIGYMSNILYLYRVQKNSLTALKSDRISQMRAKLQYKYLEWILEGIRNNPTVIVLLYNNLLTYGYLGRKQKEQIGRYLPELNGEQALVKNKKILIFGAGENGKNAYKLLADRVFAFVDSDLSKMGKQLFGLPILCPDALAELKDSYQILIAVRIGLQLEIIQCLANLGIFKYSIYVRIHTDDLNT